MEPARPYRFSDLLQDLLSEYDALCAAAVSGRPLGPVTGLDDLDTALGGFLRPGVHVLQAAPGVGKTALALQIALSCGYPFVYVTAEMRPVELFRRVVAHETRTPLSTLSGTSLDRARFHALARQTAGAHPHALMLDATLQAVPSELVVEIAGDLLQNAGLAPLIVIDSLQSWAKVAIIDRPLATEYDLITRGVRALTEIASQLSVPVLGIAQRNRAGQERGGIHSSKGSGDIEYCAESVLELSRGADTQPDGAGEIDAHVVVLKNRNGCVGDKIDLVFHGDTQAFRAAGTRPRRRRL